jgi:hypothetical protein
VPVTTPASAAPKRRGSSKLSDFSRPERAQTCAYPAPSDSVVQIEVKYAVVWAATPKAASRQKQSGLAQLGAGHQGTLASRSRSLNSSAGGGTSSDAPRFLSAGRGSILDSLGKQWKCHEERGKATTCERASLQLRLC